MNEIKEKAIKLREKGKTYKEISELLNVSLDWCKRNLKAVPYTKELDPVVAEILSLATRPQGCTNYELTGIVMKLSPHLIDDKGEYMQSYKRKVRNKSSKALFRPSWMSADKPLDSQQFLYAIANELHERINDYTQDYLDRHPEVTDRKGVTDELVKLAHGSLVVEGLSTRLSRHEATVEMLIERIG